MQPKPIPNNSDRIVDLVIADHRNRAEVGNSKYGCYLQAFNGRKSLQDVYEELLDASLYVKQKIVESDRELNYEFPDVYLLVI